MIARHPIDPARAFVTGLSAGGATTSVMLATYPEVFAAGAIIAGLPYGGAASVPQAMERMRGQGYERSALGGLVRSASAHRGPWPHMSVWHGTADTVVAPVNASLIVDQWREVQGIDGAPTVDRVAGQIHRTWHAAGGDAEIEEYVIAGMGHGTPIATSGAVAPYFRDAGISSIYRIAATCGVVPAAATAPAERSPDTETLAATSARPGDHRQIDPGRIIQDALRAARPLKQ